MVIAVGKEARVTVINEDNIIAAFSEEQVERLTGASQAKLRYWDRTGFYRPAYAENNRRLPYSRIYSFKDIVALRIINVLQNQYSVSLQHLRQVSEKLSHLVESRWTGTRLWVLNRRVIWQEPGTDLPQEVLSQQYVMEMALEVVISDTKRDIARMNDRNPDEIGHIDRLRFVSHNAPIIAGTRISVQAIKRFFEAGYSVAQIINEYPDLTEADVRAALAYKDSRVAA